MMHVYRQLSALRDPVCHVFTHKRENEATFPFHPRRLHLLPRPGGVARWWRRWVSRQWTREPWQWYDWEMRLLLLELTRVDARVLHVFFGHIAPQFRELMRVWPHPVVVSFHGADAGVNMDKPGHLKAMREVFALAARVLVRTESLGRDLEALGCPAEKITLWRTGIPLEDWAFEPRQEPPEGKWRLVQVCRFVEKKGLDLTLEAFATVRARYPNARLTLAGDGPKMGEIQGLVERMGLKEVVNFPGFLPQGRVHKLLYRCHLFLHPSRTAGDGNREGIPNAALEAMASGMPVIATTHGGFPEAIESGVSGILVPENRSDLLGEAALTVLQDPELRGRLVAGGRQVVEQRYNREAQVRLLENCYRQVMAESGRARS